MDIKQFNAAAEIVAEGQTILAAMNRFRVAQQRHETPDNLPASAITVANFGDEHSSVAIPSDLAEPMRSELQRLFRRQLSDFCRTFLGTAQIALRKRFEILTLPAPTPEDGSKATE